MNLIKDSWTKKDLTEFRTYLYSFSKGKEKSIWEQRIINTNIPCIAVPSDVIKNISNQISKGNFISFVQLWPWKNHSEVAILGSLICKIKNFDTFKSLLIIYANKIDSWAGCDCLKFKINKNNKMQFFYLSQELIKNKLPFVRRVGLLILLKMLNFVEFLDRIFDILNTFKYEEEYYVNMMLAWIVCESFVKHRDKTLQFLKTHKLSKFVINKAISKCRDSFRVSIEDKEMLLSFKKKDDNL